LSRGFGLERKQLSLYSSSEQGASRFWSYVIELVLDMTRCLVGRQIAGEELPTAVTRRMPVKRLLLLLLMTIALVPISRADTILQLSDGTETVTLTGSGIVGWAGNLNDWDINLTVGLDSSMPGPWALDLYSLNVATAPSTLQILFGETDLAAPTPGGGWDLSFEGILTGPSGSSATYNAYLDPANGALATTALIASIGPISPGGFSESASGSVPVSAGLYSLTQQLTLVAGSGTSPWRLTGFLGNARITPVPGGPPTPTATPEPTSLLLLGTGLLAFSKAALKRIRQS
jgi:hypothetical protein